MIFGANSVIATSPTLLQNWAQYMNFGYTNNNPMTIHDAWYLAARNAYHGRTYTNTMYNHATETLLAVSSSNGSRRVSAG